MYKGSSRSNHIAAVIAMFGIGLSALFTLATLLLAMHFPDSASVLGVSLLEYSLRWPNIWVLCVIVVPLALSIVFLVRKKLELVAGMLFISTVGYWYCVVKVFGDVGIAGEENGLSVMASVWQLMFYGFLSPIGILGALEPSARRFSKTQLWTRIKDYVIGAGFIIATTALFIIYSASDKASEELDRRGLPATATVMDKSLSRSSRGAVISRDLQVRYTDNTKIDHDAYVEVTEADYNEYVAGDSIDILYDPANTRSAKVRWYTFSRHENWAWLSAGIGGVWLISRVFGWVKAARKRKR